MPDRIVINTGPLIALANADAVEVVSRLPFQFLCHLVALAPVIDRLTQAGAWYDAALIRRVLDAAGE